jgi:probable rRNA maturation factor
MTGSSSGGAEPGQAGPGPEVDVLIESTRWQALPAAEDIVRRAIALAARAGQAKAVRYRCGAELSVLLCDDEAMAGLNARWRGHDRPTNVLSFPAPQRAPAAASRGPDRPAPLGDIAIAYETAAREAAEQDKPLADHLAHLVIHGFLHLLGYDHHMDGEAERMERLERDILAQIGIADPYDGWTHDR